MTDWLILDTATAPIDGAAEFLDVPTAPSNWKDPAKIRAYVEEKTAERLAGTSLDLDLCRLTALGTLDAGGVPEITLCRTELDEAKALADLAVRLTDPHGAETTHRTLVTFNGLAFDLPLLQRRARYLDVPFPRLSTDRYRSPHVDLLALLSDRDPSRRRSLTFYCRRLGWLDLIDKPLSGADEAQVLETGAWDQLAASVRRDVMAVYRLAQWWGALS